MNWKTERKNGRLWWVWRGISLDRESAKCPQRHCKLANNRLATLWTVTRYVYETVSWNVRPVGRGVVSPSIASCSKTHRVVPRDIFVSCSIKRWLRGNADRSRLGWRGVAWITLAAPSSFRLVCKDNHSSPLCAVEGRSDGWKLSSRRPWIEEIRGDNLLYYLKRNEQWQIGISLRNNN